MKGRRPHTYSQTFNKPKVTAVVNENKILKEPHAELVQEAYERMQNIDLNNEYSSAQHHNEHEIFLSKKTLMMKVVIMQFIIIVLIILKY